MALYFLLKFTLFFIFLFALIIPFQEMEAKRLTNIFFWYIMYCLIKYEEIVWRKVFALFVTTYHINEIRNSLQGCAANGEMITVSLRVKRPRIIEKKTYSGYLNLLFFLLLRSRCLDYFRL